MTTPALAQNVRGKGRHYAHPVSGDLVPSVTNIIGVLDKPALPRWAAKSVAENAWKMRHSLIEMGEEECIDVLKGSPWRKSTRAADRGTTIHDYLDAAAHGVFLSELEGEAASYKVGADDFLCRYQPEFVRTEFSVFGDGYAGTADAMGVIGGRLAIWDYKTGKGLYPEVALQLAAIRHAAEIASDEGIEPMPEVEVCFAVLITPERSFVHEVAADAEAFRAFLACRDAWTWQKSGTPIGVELAS